MRFIFPTNAIITVKHTGQYSNSQPRVKKAGFEKIRMMAPSEISKNARNEESIPRLLCLLYINIILTVWVKDI